MDQDREKFDEDNGLGSEVCEADVYDFEDAECQFDEASREYADVYDFEDAECQFDEASREYADVYDFEDAECQFDEASREYATLELQCMEDSKKEKRGRPKGMRTQVHVSPETERNSTKRAKTDSIPINRLAAYLCCTAVCLSSVTAEALETARNNFRSLSVLQRSQWILGWIITHTRTQYSTVVFLVAGTEVCRKAWLACLGIPQSTFYSIWKKALDGIRNIVGPGNVKGTVKCETQYAMSWLNDFASEFADKMPDSHKLHLPCCLRKNVIYDMMCTEAEVYGEKTISLTHFLRIWRRYLPHIVIPKRSRFSVCDVCNKIKSRLEKSTSRDEKKQLFKVREQHLEQQNKERRKYYKHAQKGRRHKDLYLSVIIDGMDQDKTSLPHYCSLPKGLSNLWKLKINLMGSIVHGYGFYGFFDSFQWAHGSSFTISVLVHTLLMMTHLPPVLYLQLDNCPGQNKNSFSVWLGTRDITTFDELVSGFENCYTPNPTGIRMHEVYNVAEHLDLNNIVNHSRTHVFKIVKENNKAVLFTKKWSTDRTWVRCEGEYLLREKNENAVRKISPSADRTDEKVINDLQTFAKFYKDDKMGNYWEKYFAELRSEEDNWDDDSAVDIIKKLKEKKLQEEERHDDRINIINELGLPGINDPIPPVIIGKIAKKAKNVMEEGTFVLLDWAKYADVWPQVAKILKLGQEEAEVQWYKGAKTTAWTPATRRVKGCRGGGGGGGGGN